MAFLDRTRAARLLGTADLGALVLTQPENFHYATGAAPGVATMWRRAGAAVALVPADPAQTPAAVVTDLFAAAFRAASDIADVRVHPIWVETTDLTGFDLDRTPARELVAHAARREGRPEGFARPTTFDARAGFGLLREALAERGLLRARIGIDLGFLPAADFELLKAVIPEASWVDATGIVARLRMVKTPAEIAFLRTAVELAEAGISRLAAEIRPGASRDALAAAWREGVADAARRRGVRNLTGAWEYVSVGPDPWGPGAPAAPGDLVKVDVGCLVAGYTSDSGRTFAVGRASPVQRALFEALASAFEAGLAELRPGRTLADVHRAATAAMREAGFPSYTRGHFGHGLGAGVGSEEWPFIAADADIPVEPGMVLAFETPWYVTGVGGIIIEDQVLITPQGAEPMNRLPRGLIEIG